MWQMREHDPKVQNKIFAFDQQGREVFNIGVSHQMSLFFDVYPGKYRIGKLIGERIEPGAIISASTAPLCAQAEYLEQVIIFVNHDDAPGNKNGQPSYPFRQKLIKSSLAENSRQALAS